MRMTQLVSFSLIQSFCLTNCFISYHLSCTLFNFLGTHYIARSTLRSAKYDKTEAFREYLVALKTVASYFRCSSLQERSSSFDFV